MSKYLNDPREMSIRPESGITLEEDNRIEKMYHWGAKVLDLCDLPVEEYMKPMTVIINEGGGVSPEPEPEQHEYVDLGLPSGTLWAKHNIQDKDGNDLYFAWGETSGYTKSQIRNGVRSFTLQYYEYNENPSTLDSAHDAATVNWGEEWKMPTKEQFDELISSANTKTAWKQIDGVYGLLCTSKVNNNTLFFPAVGNAGYSGVGDAGVYGRCWSVSLYDDDVNNACDLYFYGGGCEVSIDSRCYGCSVRPVRSNN